MSKIHWPPKTEFIYCRWLSDKYVTGRELLLRLDKDWAAEVRVERIVDKKLPFHRNIVYYSVKKLPLYRKLWYICYNFLMWQN